MTKQAEALSLAEVFERFKESSHRWTNGKPIHLAAAAELRSLHAQVQKLQSELVAEAARTAAEKLRADQMTLQHDMQSAMHREARHALTEETEATDNWRMAGAAVRRPPHAGSWLPESPAEG